MGVSDTLAERAKTYGDFRDIARISGALQRVMHGTRNWGALPEDAREALQTIASKIARILNGDPEHLDSWHDISGYATLVENRLRESEAKIDAVVRRHCVPMTAADDGAESAVFHPGVEFATPQVGFVPRGAPTAVRGPDPERGLATPPAGFVRRYDQSKPGGPWWAKRDDSEIWHGADTADRALDAARKAV